MSDFMTETTKAMIYPVTGEIIDQKDLAVGLLAQAKEQGVSVVGPGGLLNELTRNVRKWSFLKLPIITTRTGAAVQPIATVQIG